MKRTVWIWELFGFAAVSLGGTLLHFLYEWLNKPLWIAVFSGVNESTFEHMKLLFWPMLIYTIAESFFFRAYDSFICIKLRGTLLGLILIPIMFYTYNGVIGRSPDWINIAIFFVAAGAAFIYETKALTKDTAQCRSKRLAIGVFCLLGVAFAIFTFRTPTLEIFRDPVTSSYGI